MFATHFATMITRRAALALAFLAAALTLASPDAQAQAAKPEKPKLTLAVGGVSSQIYFVVPNLAQRLGYFKDEGLEIETVDTESGSKGLQALLGGSAELTAGAYEHTIQMQAKGVAIRSIALYGRSGGTVLGIAKAKAKSSPPSVKDLKGDLVGVSAPGSSTHVFLNLVLGKAGMTPDDVSILGVGNSSAAVAALRAGRVAAISSVDPIMTELDLAGDIVVLADARTPEGGQAIYGGPYASGCIYVPAEFIAKYPNTAQAIANAIVRTLKWIKAAPVDKIIAALPPEYSRANPTLYRAALERNLSGIPDDGLVSEAAAKTVLTVVAKSDAKFDASKIDLAKTYDNRFVQNALQKFK